MLVRFNVKNFLSFSESPGGQSEEFSMFEGAIEESHSCKGKINLLKLSAIYGANASGKSNIVKAIDFMKTTILGKLPEGHTEKYCKIDRKNKDRSSYFELEINIDDRYFSYGFEIILSQSKFISEWLIERSVNAEENIIFERNIESGEYQLASIFMEDEEKNKNIKVYIEDIKDDYSVLFLKVMNQNKKRLYEENRTLSIFQDIYTWVQKKLNITYPGQPVSDYSYMITTDKIEEVCSILSAFGTGIKKYEKVRVHTRELFKDIPEPIRKDILTEVEKRLAEHQRHSLNGEFTMVKRGARDIVVMTIRKNNEEDMEDVFHCETIKFSHERDGILYDLSEESDGTIRLLDLIEVLLSESNKTYIIDELDRCLHPNLTYKFIETFLVLAKKRKVQLIATTHESRLLDFNLLRRDEVWFVEKDSNGVSHLYSLNEYNRTFDHKIDKAYLDGRYGGVPVFTAVFPVERGE